MKRRDLPSYAVPEEVKPKGLLRAYTDDVAGEEAARDSTMGPRLRARFLRRWPSLYLGRWWSRGVPAAPKGIGLGEAALQSSRGKWNSGHRAAKALRNYVRDACKVVRSQVQVTNCMADDSGFSKQLIPRLIVVEQERRGSWCHPLDSVDESPLRSLYPRLRWATKTSLSTGHG